ncbi:MAG: hypothetical protein ACI83B_003414, partial [Sediminicola sp.]
FFMMSYGYYFLKGNITFFILEKVMLNRFVYAAYRVYYFYNLLLSIK